MTYSTPQPPRLHRFTVDEYYRMGDLDFFAPDAREELIDGEIFDIPPPSPKHANTVMYMHNVVPRALWDLTIVSILNPMRLSDYTEVLPDIALLRPRDDYYAARRPGPADALLIMEVADVSLQYDRERKIPLYATHGVAELWLVDLIGKRLLRHRSPEPDRYAIVDELDPRAPLEAAGLPGLQFEWRRLFV